MSDSIRAWKTSAIYTHGRVAEFVMAAMGLPLTAEEHEVLLEYVSEAEHQDGGDYWANFSSLSAALEDFTLYLKGLGDR